MTLEFFNVTNRNIYRALQAFIVSLNAFILLPAVLFQAGFQKLSEILYLPLGLLCHQIADRSFFLFGQKFMYSQAEVLTATTPDTLYTINLANRFTCGGGLGCKFGVCSRCTGIYTGMLSGMIVASATKNIKRPLKVLIPMLVPMVVDGIVQLVAFVLNPVEPFYESNNRLRFFTGFLFGAGFGWYAFTILKEQMMIEQQEA